MAIAKQIAANRQHAQRSTGPRMAAGKATTARNASKHGLFAREVPAMGESAAGFAELGRRLREALAPEGALEEALCARIVGCLWRLRRVVRLESSIVANEDGLFQTSLLEPGWLRHDEADWLDLFSRYEARLDRCCTAPCTNCSASRPAAAAPTSRRPWRWTSTFAGSGVSRARRNDL
jgi:hypothetical protein